MFLWAHFRRTKAVIKLHTQIDLTRPIPVFLSITDRSVHDVHFLDQIAYKSGNINVTDRGYLDFARLFCTNKAKAHFVIRSKSNTRFYVLESSAVEKTTGLRCDQRIRLSSRKGKLHYLKRLQCISYVDTQSGKGMAFLTNHFDLPALTIAAIYKNRWQIELFFKWIKQNLRIKTFTAPARMPYEPKSGLQSAFA